MGGTYVFPTFVLQLVKNLGKSSTRKSAPTGHRTRACRREAPMLPLDHSGGIGNKFMVIIAIGPWAARQLSENPVT